MSRHIAFQLLTEQFKAELPRCRDLGYLLIEAADTAKDRLLEVPPFTVDHPNRQVVQDYPTRYRGPGIPLNEHGLPFLTDRPSHDLEGKPIANLRGEFYVFEEGLSRSGWYYGNVEARRTLSSLATHAGQLVIRFQERLTGVLPAEVFCHRDDRRRWLWILFELAWQQRPNIPLIAERRTWIENHSVPYATVDLFEETEPGDAPFAEGELTDQPHYFFSQIDDVLQASLYALCSLESDLEADLPPSARPGLPITTAIQPPSFVPTDADDCIIRALADAPTTQSQTQIADRSGHPISTVKERMPILERAGMVDRPHGPKKGYALTRER